MKMANSDEELAFRQKEKETLGTVPVEQCDSNRMG